MGVIAEGVRYSNNISLHDFLDNLKLQHIFFELLPTENSAGICNFPKKLANQCCCNIDFPLGSGSLELKQLNALKLECFIHRLH